MLFLFIALAAILLIKPLRFLAVTMSVIGLQVGLVLGLWQVLFMIL